MYPMIDKELIRQAEIEARRSGARAQRRREAAAAAAVQRPVLGSRVDVVIREAGAEDTLALMQLADLDSHTPPIGRVIVAEAAGKIRAAIAVDDGALIADPFVATAQLEDLLRLRMKQIRAEARSARRRSGGPFGRPHLRPRRAV